MNDEQPTVTTSARQGRKRLLLMASGLLGGLLLAEIGLKISGRPRFHEPHTSPPQFMFGDHIDFDTIGYVNKPSSNIVFEYGSNPRNYFGPRNEVGHLTNAIGFRGRPFPFELDPAGNEILIPKRDESIRLAFLGDSFTFGEGVRDEDTYAQVTATHLQEKHAELIVEAANFGVGGYNTTQSRHVLERWALKSNPDVVILGFVLNDAEPPIFQRDPTTGRPVRRRLAVEQGQAGNRPPAGLLYRSSIARLFWQARAAGKQTQSTFAHYRSLYRGKPTENHCCRSWNSANKKKSPATCCCFLSSTNSTATILSRMSTTRSPSCSLAVMPPSSICSRTCKVRKLPACGCILATIIPMNWCTLSLASYWRNG